MRILSIETSCDETSMALVDMVNVDNDINILIHGHFTASQAQYHAQYGGVFPAMAKLEHIKACLPLLHTLFAESGISIPEDEWASITPGKEQIENINKILHREIELANGLVEFCTKEKFPKIDLISVTNGPGLEMALWVGINFAKSLGEILNVPVVGTNHMMGHLYSGLLPEDILHKEIKLNPIPNDAIALLVSGGHTELIQVESYKVESEKKKTHIQQYTLLGATLDDAVGEAFDKVARMLDLPYPGGPAISKLAETKRRYSVSGSLAQTSESNGEVLDQLHFPRPMLHSKNYDFSYSGLKTAVLYYIQKNPINEAPDQEDYKMDIALAFEDAAIEVLVKKTIKAMDETGANVLLVGGGVSANNYLKKELINAGKKYNFSVHFPLQSLTGDNALMIALATGIEYLYKEIKNQKDELKANGMLKIA